MYWNPEASIYFSRARCTLPFVASAREFLWERRHPGQVDELRVSLKFKIRNPKNEMKREARGRCKGPAKRRPRRIAAIGAITAGADWLTGVIGEALILKAQLKSLHELPHRGSGAAVRRADLRSTINGVIRGGDYEHGQHDRSRQTANDCPRQGRVSLAAGPQLGRQGQQPYEGRQ